MFTRMGAGGTIMYDPARIHERYGLTPAPDDRLQGAQGRHDRQHPGPRRGRRQDRRQAARGLRLARRRVRARRRGQAGQAAREARREQGRRAAVARPRDHRPGRADRSWTWRRRGSATTTGRRSSGCSGSTSSGRSWSGCRRSTARTARAPGDLLREADRLGPVPAAQVAGRAPRRGATLLGEGSGLQLSLDFDAPGGGCHARPRSRRPTAVPARRAATRAADRRPTIPVELLRRRRSRTRRDRGRPGRPADDLAAWLAAQSELDRRRGPRRRAAAAGHAARPRGRGARTAAWSPPATDGATALADAVMAAGKPLVGPRRQAAARLGAVAARPDGRDAASAAAADRCRASCFDTQIAAYILNAALRSPVARRHQRRAPRHRAAAGRRAARSGAGGGDRRSPRPPRASRSTRTLADEPGLQRVLDELELPLIPVLADMEATGVAIDVPALGELGRTFTTEIARLQETIFESVGHQFTLGSPKQLEQVLFYELNLPRGKRTKTGFSTDASVLEDLRAGAPDGRQAARLAAVHQAPLDLRRRAAAAARPDHRSAAHDVPAGRRRDRAALVDRPEPPEHPHPHGAGPQDPARVRVRRARTACCWPPTTARSSCASWPTCRATCTSRRRSSGAPTSIARPPRGCSRRTPPT